MTFTIPGGLAPEVYPLAWLVGRWEGAGVVVYPPIPEARVRQEVLVDHDGGPYLRWSSTLWLAGDATGEAVAGVGPAEPAGRAPRAPVEPGPVWSTESGYWRVPPDRPEDIPDGKDPVELLLIDPAGHLTLYAGVAGNGRIDLASDLIARTPDAAEVNAATRLYGLVDGALLWAWDIAAFGEPLQSYASARLTRVPR